MYTIERPTNPAPSTRSNEPMTGWHGLHPTLLGLVRRSATAIDLPAGGILRADALPIRPAIWAETGIVVVLEDKVPMAVLGPGEHFEVARHPSEFAAADPDAAGRALRVHAVAPSRILVLPGEAAERVLVLAPHLRATPATGPASRRR